MLHAIENVESYGKFVNSIKDEYPMFPDLHILVFKEPESNPIYTHVAVCIELELDACGTSGEDALEALQRAVKLYFDSLFERYKTNEGFIQNIIENIFLSSEQKNNLFSVFMKAEQKYFIEKLQQNEIRIPKLKPSSIRRFSKHEEGMLSAVGG